MKDNTAAHPAGFGPHRHYRHATVEPDVLSITAAPEAHSDEMRTRMIKYATAMGIRMVCLVLIFVFPGWFKLVPIIGAVLLPWVAVVIANGGSDITTIDTSALLDEAPMYELDGDAAATFEAAAPEDDIIQGVLIDDGNDGTAPGQESATETADDDKEPHA